MRLPTAAALAGLTMWIAPVLAANGLDPVEPPEFGRPGPVLDSIETMMDRLEPLAEEATSWQAVRAWEMCRTIQIRLEGRVTSNSYSPDVGRTNWRLCHEAYANVPAAG